MKRTATLDEFIGRLCDGPEKHATGVIYRGSYRRVNIFSDPCCDGISVSNMLPEGFEYIEEFEDGPYRKVWKSDRLRAIVTYCEGDVSVTVDPDQTSYAARLAAQFQFYVLGIREPQTQSEELETAQWYTAGGYAEPALQEKLKGITLAWQYGGLVTWRRLPETAKRIAREHLAAIRSN